MIWFRAGASSRERILGSGASELSHREGVTHPRGVDKFKADGADSLGLPNLRRLIFLVLVMLLPTLRRFCHKIEIVAYFQGISHAKFTLSAKK